MRVATPNTSYWKGESLDNDSVVGSSQSLQKGKVRFQPERTPT